MDPSESKKDVKATAAASSADFRFGSPTTSDNAIDKIKVESLDDDEGDGEGGGDLSGSTSTPSVHYRNDRAPIPGNCCKFSTLSCSRFWAILNCVQLIPTWILLCAVNFGDLMDQNHTDDMSDKLAKCLEGGSSGARGTKLACQIVLLLMYTGASVLFTAANFPLSPVLQFRQLFTKLYLWSLVCFFLAFLMPVPFQLALSQCYYLVSLLAWMQVLSQLSLCVVFLYFSWRVVTIFQVYLEATNCTPKKTSGGSKSLIPPPTPVPSQEDIQEK